MVNETLSTTFKDSGSNGRITLYGNPFNNGNLYYGRFERNTINTKTLIARIQQRKAGTNELAVQEIAGFLKEEILLAIKRGEAVNIMDLGILYIAPNRKFIGTAMKEDDNIPQLAVKFCPSSLVRDAVSEVRIKEINIAPEVRLITEIKDLYTGAVNEKISVGRSVGIKGSKIKVKEYNGSKDEGIFLCPVDGEGNVDKDGLFIKCDKIVKNTSGAVEFYVPDDVERNKKYRILVRTHYCTSAVASKYLKEIYSDVIETA